jgi:transcriptional antiterminator NusG
MCAEENEAALELVEERPEVEAEMGAAETASDVAEGAAGAAVEPAVEVAAALVAEAETGGVPEGIVTVEELQASEAEEAVEIEEAEELSEAPQIPEAAVTEEAAGAEAEAEEGELAPEPVEVEVPDDGRAWYVIHCYSGYEAKVKHNLEQRIETMQMQDQIFQVVVPTEDEIEVRDGKRRVIERRVFPGYILVQMLLNDDSWYVVRNTPGVTGFVGMGNEPTPLRPEEVQSIIRRMEAEAPKIKVTFRQGQKVRIIDGPFNEFIGMVDEIDMERAKVRVLVSFFGRETPVELDFLQVEKT